MSQYPMKTGEYVITMGKGTEASPKNILMCGTFKTFEEADELRKKMIGAAAMSVETFDGFNRYSNSSKNKTLQQAAQEFTDAVKKLLKALKNMVGL